MVQGVSTRQKAAEKTAPRAIAFANLGRKPPLAPAAAGWVRRSVSPTRVRPTAAANSPLSGLKSTAMPATIPVINQSRIVLLQFEDLNASVAVRQMASARKIVGVSVKIVAV